MDKIKRIIVGISGASGAIYGIRALELLRELPDMEIHLVVSKAAQITIAHETNYKLPDIIKLAHKYHPIDDISSSIASGSFKTMGMIIAPCSVKTMAEIACGVTNNLMSRAADVVLKEKRPLILMVRETPLHYGHLSNMAKITQMGAVIAPPVPAFYSKPKSLDDIINHSVVRSLDLLGIELDLIQRWSGL